MRILRCSEVSELASKALDRKLTWRERIGCYAHLALCKPCVRFRRQLGFLRRAAAAAPDHPPAASGPGLSAGARDRIRSLLNQGR